MPVVAIAFDNTITLGAVLQIVTLLGVALAAFYAVKNRIEVFQTILQEHGQALHKHDAVLQIYETRIFELVGGLQRLVGRIEASDRRHDQK